MRRFSYSTEAFANRAVALRARFEAGDATALIEALLQPLLLPPGERDRPEPGPLSTVPTWALMVAVGHVLKAVGGPDLREISLPPSKRGSSAPWLRRFSLELRDLECFIRVQLARYCRARFEGDPFDHEDLLGRQFDGAPTLTVEEACANVVGAERDPDAIRKAYQRAKRRLTADPLRYYILGRLLGRSLEKNLGLSK